MLAEAAKNRTVVRGVAFSPQCVYRLSFDGVVSFGKNAKLWRPYHFASPMATATTPVISKKKRPKGPSEEGGASWLAEGKQSVEREGSVDLAGMPQSSDRTANAEITKELGSRRVLTQCQGKQQTCKNRRTLFAPSVIRVLCQWQHLKPQHRPSTERLTIAVPARETVVKL